MYNRIWFCDLLNLAIVFLINCLVTNFTTEENSRQYDEYIFNQLLCETSLCIPFSVENAYSDRQLTHNSEFEIFCVPTFFHKRIPKPCLSVCPYPEKRNHPGFVNNSPTLVINTSMERSSRVLQHGNPKNLIFL